MENTKITVLGMSGSGKTCYLLALYYKMLAGIEGYTLTTDDKRDVELRDLYSKLRNGKLKEKRFPAGTNSGTFEKYTFDLCQSFEKIMSFDWIDYAGGDLDNKVGAYEQLEQDIYDSSSLFIFVDGLHFIKDSQTGEELEDIGERIESVSLANQSVNNILARYSKRNNETNKNYFPPIAIVITKYDLLLAHGLDSEEELCEIVQKAFNPLFGSKANKIERIITIIPISLGANISENDYSGKLKPINMDLPILFGIYFTIVKQQFAQHCESIYSFMEKFGKKKQEISVSRNQRIEKLTSERDSELARLEKYRKDKLAELEKTHRDEVSKLERDSKRKLSDLEDELDSRVSEYKEAGNSKIKKLKSDSESEIASLTRNRDSKLSELVSDRDSTLSSLHSKLNSEMDYYDNALYKKRNAGIGSRIGSFFSGAFGGETLESEIARLESERSSTRSDLQNRIANTESSANMEIENVKNSANANISNVRNRASREVETAQSNMERNIAEVTNSLSKEINTLKSSTARKIDSIHRDSEQKIQDVKTTTSENINNVKTKAEKDIKDVDNAIKRDIEKLSAQTDDDIKKIKQMREDLHLYTDNIIPSFDRIPRWYRFSKDSETEVGKFEDVMDIYVKNISDADFEQALRESSKAL